MRKISSVLLCALLALLLCGCPNPRVMEQCATSQKGTTWKSTDGRVTFFVDDDDSVQAVCPVFGTVETGNGTEEIAIFMTYLTTMADITPADDPGALDPKNVGHSGLESWSYSNVREDSFEIEVTKGHWLKTGETLTFYRVDEEGVPKK